MAVAFRLDLVHEEPQPQRTNTVPTRPSPAEAGDLGHDHAGLLLCDHLSQWTIALLGESGGLKVVCSSRAQAAVVLLAAVHSGKMKL